MTEPSPLPHAADRTAIARALETYLDALHHCDSARLREVLHAQALYATASDGSLLVLDMPTYWRIIDRRLSPARQGHARQDVVTAIEVIGGDTALARVRCAAPPKYYDDVLTLLKVDGRWWIFSKVFHYDLRASEAA